MVLVRHLRPLATRGFPSQRYRTQSTQSTYQAPTPPKSQSNPHRDFYRQFGLVTFKNFLIAMFTYQVIYWSWLKLESEETKRQMGGEVKSLEGEIRRMSKEKAAGSP